MTATPSPPSDLPQFERLGHYRVVRKIAEGGMGAVYEAEQDNPRRTVALKVIRAGLTSDSLLRRFEHEAQILGRLHHVGIAQVFEAGTATTAAGPQPYFVMELVHGLSLTDYAKRHELDLRERLELIVKVCDAVHHAHLKGVIHRDLKPANILVEEGGQPKILDFGVARATDSDVRTATMHTDTGQLLGTLPYMSPEQVAADPLELDVRSDVYALGVILYELVSGRSPYELRDKLIYEAVRVIREVDPVPLSSIDRVFRGDVETIVAKALEKDKARRYASADDLAHDIRRYLKDEPIIARPASTIYQFEKFARRNKVLVGGIAAVFVVLVLGVVASLWQAIRATEAEGLAQVRLVKVNEALALVEKKRNEAEAARTEAERLRIEAERQRGEAETNFGLARSAVASYLDKVSDNADLKAHGLEPLRRQLLDTARSYYERFVEQHAHDAELQADLAEACHRLGNIDRELGNHETAVAFLLRSRAAYEALARGGGEGASAKGGGERLRFEKQALATASDLALAYADSSRMAEAERAFLDAIGLDRLLRQDEDPDPFFVSVLANTYDHVGTLYDYSGRAAQGEESHLHALALREKLSAKNPDDADIQSALIRSYNNIATLYAQTNRAGEAAPYVEKGVELCDRLVEKHPNDPTHRANLGATLNNLAGVYTLLEKPAEARATHERALGVREKLARAHPAVPLYRMQLAGSYCNLGELDCREGKFARGLEWLDRASATLDGVLAERADDATARYYQSYTSSWRARALVGLGREEEALAAWERAIALDPRSDVALHVGRAQALVQLGRYADAAAEVAVVAGNAQLPPDALCQLAGVMSQCVRSATKDAQAAPQASEEYASRAIDLLHRAAKSGAEGRVALATYLNDRALEALRERPDFAALRSEVAGQ